MALEGILSQTTQRNIAISLGYGLFVTCGSLLPVYLNIGDSRDVISANQALFIQGSSLAVNGIMAYYTDSITKAFLRFYRFLGIQI